MVDVIAQYYLWFKSIHIIALISWMAGLLYLPRLYVYHVGAEPGSPLSETFKGMELKLLRFIMNPAMILTYAFGGLLLLVPGVVVKPYGWLHVKLLLVLILTVFHGCLARWRKDFSRDHNLKSARFFRLANEVPTIIMIFIVFLVVMKPF